VRLAPWRAHNWFIHASALEVRGEAPEALRAAMRAADLERGNFRYALRVATMAEKAGDVALADEWYQRTLRADPYTPSPIFAVAEWDIRRQRTVEAIELLERTVKLQPDFPRAWLALGKLEAERGNIRHAIAAYEQVLRFDPGNAPAQQFLKDHAASP
jgi:tetratricopeptide (TPR) repeat protein